MFFVLKGVVFVNDSESVGCDESNDVIFVTPCHSEIGCKTGPNEPEQIPFGKLS